MSTTTLAKSEVSAHRPWKSSSGTAMAWSTRWRLLSDLLSSGLPGILQGFPYSPFRESTGKFRSKTEKPENTVKSWKNLYLSWNSGVLGVSRRSARTIRNFSFEFWPDLVLLDIRKSTFQHLTVNFVTEWSQNLPYGPRPREQKLLFSIFTYPIIHLKNRGLKDGVHKEGFETILWWSVYRQMLKSWLFDAM